MVTFKKFFFHIALIILIIQDFPSVYAHGKTTHGHGHRRSSSSSHRNHKIHSSIHTGLSSSSSGNAQVHTSFDATTSCKGAFSKVYAFGGSYTDTGNAFLMGILKSFFNFWHPGDSSGGRLCNGKLVIDYLSEAFGIPPPPPYKNASADFSSGANFATSGSTVLPTNFFTQHFNIQNSLWKVTPISIEMQMEWFNKFLQDVKSSGVSGGSSGGVSGGISGSGGMSGGISGSGGSSGGSSGGVSGGSSGGVSGGSSGGVSGGSSGGSSGGVSGGSSGGVSGGSSGGVSGGSSGGVSGGSSGGVSGGSSGGVSGGSSGGVSGGSSGGVSGGVSGGSSGGVSGGSSSGVSGGSSSGVSGGSSSGVSGGVSSGSSGGMSGGSSSGVSGGSSGSTSGSGGGVSGSGLSGGSSSGVSGGSSGSTSGSGGGVSGSGLSGGVSAGSSSGMSGGSNSKLMDDALFWFGAVGATDYGLIGGSTSSDWLANLAVNITCNMLKRAIDVGAKYIVVQGLPPIGCLPLKLSLTPSTDRDNYSCCASANAAIFQHNQLLQKALIQMQSQYKHCTIVYADFAKAYLTILSHYGDFHFTEAFKACCGFNGNPLNFDMFHPCGSLLTMKCGNAGMHMVWDGIHFTTDVYKLVAQMFLSQSGFTTPCLADVIKKKIGM